MRRKRQDYIICINISAVLVSKINIPSSVLFNCPITLPCFDNTQLCPALSKLSQILYNLKLILALNISLLLLCNMLLLYVYLLEILQHLPYKFQHQGQLLTLYVRVVNFHNKWLVLFLHDQLL